MRCPPGRSGAADPACRATLDLYQTLIVMSGATAEKRRAGTGFDRAGAPTCRAFPATSGNFADPAPGPANPAPRPGERWSPARRDLHPGLARINFAQPVTGV